MLVIRIMIVKNLRYCRENLELKQKEIADILGVTYSTVSGWETGKDTIPLRKLIDFANIYNLSLDYLFGLTNTNEKYKTLTVDLKVVGKNLRNIRLKNKKTQSEVAEIINTSQSAYAHYENAIYLIPTSFLYNLSKIYPDFSIDLVLGREKVSDNT